MAWHFNEHGYLTTEEQQDNIIEFYNRLIINAWTVESISAMLGNIQSESSFNPGAWENGDVGNMDVGFGLVQWTPASKFINWAEGDGYTYTDGNAQCDRIDFEVFEGLQWIPTSEYDLSFGDFKYSTDPPDYLAMAFLYNYERPADLNQPQRGEQALVIYEFLTGIKPPSYKNKSKWIYYMRKL